MSQHLSLKASQWFAGLLLGSLLALTVWVIFVPTGALAVSASSISSDNPKPALPLPEFVPAQSNGGVKDLEAELQKKRDSLEVLQKQIQIYKKTVDVKQGERLTLQRELSALEQNMTSTALELRATQQQLDILALETEKTKKKLQKLATEKRTERQRLRTLLAILRAQADYNPLQLFLVAERFSDVYDTIAVGEQLNRALLANLDRLKDIEAQAAARRDELDASAAAERTQQAALVTQKLQLEDQRETKDFLLAKTQESEKKFQQFLEQARNEEEQADADIRRLEQDIRTKLEAQPQTRGKLGVGEKVPMIYPVPFQGISAGFHDPTYVFRRIFEHPAVDLRTLVAGRPTNAQPVRAAASGYVGRARDGGMGYSYIMLIHSDRISTVYGHVSKIMVAPEQYVNQGDVIALSGGLPGTPGAGRLTTGPHLHFEVRLDGIPVNPLNYLPPT